MQTKKRAKPIKFGIKPEQPISDVSREPKPLNMIHKPDENVKAHTEHHVTRITHKTLNTYDEIQSSESHDINNNTSPGRIESQPVSGYQDNPANNTNISHARPEAILVQNPEPTFKKPEYYPPFLEEKKYIPESPRQPEQLPSVQERQKQPGYVAVEEIEKPQSSYQASESSNPETSPGQFTEGFQNPTPPPQEEQIPSAPISDFGGDTYIVEKEVKRGVLGYFFLIAIISFIIGIITMAGISFFLPKTQLPIGIPIVTQAPTATIIQAPSVATVPTEKKVDLSAYSIEIRNGSGVTGAATKLKESLNALGFNVIDVGNAESSDYTDTEIYSKEDADKDYLVELENELKKIYSVKISKNKPSLVKTSADIIITLGIESASKSAN